MAQKPEKKPGKRPEQHARDRAIWFVRLVTLGVVGGALALTWAFGALAELFFSGKQPAPFVPSVPVADAPVQKAPPVIVTIVHHPGQTAPKTSSGTTTARPPATKPAPAPPPPPKAVCHSTPSKPC